MWILLFYVVTLFEYMSQQFCYRLSELQSDHIAYMLKKTNSTHLFSLGYKTLGGTFFCYDWCNHAYFKTLLEYGYFIIFSVTWQFHVTLNMPWHHAMWHVPQNFFFFPLSKQGTPKVKKTENKIVADSFVLFSYPIWVHWCPSFVGDIRSAIT